jgi:hypothetical protein
MKDTWIDVFDSKAFILSLIASLFTIFLVGVHDLILLRGRAYFDEYWFEVGFIALILGLMYFLVRKYRRLKDVEAELDKIKNR